MTREDHSMSNCTLLTARLNSNNDEDTTQAGRQGCQAAYPAGIEAEQHGSVEGLQDRRDGIQRGLSQIEPGADRLLMVM